MKDQLYDENPVEAVNFSFSLWTIKTFMISIYEIKCSKCNIFLSQCHIRDVPYNSQLLYQLVYSIIGSK